ncbi:MAG: phosphotransferase [Nannocystaceae bacterium]
MRAASQANETWLGDGFALRVNFRGDLGRLKREAELAAQLPVSARYPGVLTCGDDGVIEWLLSRRVAGVALAHAWTDLEDRQRAQAIRDLADALRALHGVDARALAGDRELAPPHVLPLAPLVELIEKLADRRLLPLELAAALRRHVEGRWDAFDEGNVGLVHGDPHLENVLWDGAQVSAVLDLEWARRSYLECDLETLLSFFDHPRLFVAVEHEPRARAEDYAEAPAWLCDRYPELFAHPRLADRLGILHLSRTLTIVDESPSPAAVSPLRLAQLRAVLSGSSFLDRAASTLRGQ